MSNRLVCATLVQFDETKCKVLCLGWGSHKLKYRLGDECIENSTMEKDLGVLDDKKLNMTQQCVLVVQKAK